MIGIWFANVPGDDRLWLLPHALWVIAGAVLLDRLIGDPRWLPHPVVGMGKLISILEQSWNRGAGRKGKGVLLAVVVVAAAYTATVAFLWAAYQLNYYLGLMMECAVLSTTIAAKGLKDAALAVAKPLAQGNLPEARQQLGMIVGRDTAELEEPEIVRGAVETVAENTVDGVTAPLFWMLAGGVPAAVAYRAVNTLDSMVGYKNERYRQFGWASARLDDAANWIPARLTMACMGAAAWFIPGLRRRAAWGIALRDAPKHPSPNSGWPEAMTAGLLGIELGGRNTYQGVVSERARMGTKLRELECADIGRAIAIMQGGSLVFALLIGAVVWLAS